MPRYFLEICYKGTHFKGFQSQENAITIQGEINKAFALLFKSKIETTSASRTDAGVHALQNYLHLDLPEKITQKHIYNANSILNRDIVIRNVYEVFADRHSRFDALTRVYDYFLTNSKDPFHTETSYFYPFSLDLSAMNEAAQMLLQTTDFSSFAKRHSDVNNFNCKLIVANWYNNKSNQIVFHVESNRFLRGMVRALVGTQLLVGRHKITLNDFREIINAKDCTKADFSAPAHGLFLSNIKFPASLLTNPIN